MGSRHIIVHKVKKSCMDIFVKTENCEGGSCFWKTGSDEENEIVT